MKVETTTKLKIKSEDAANLKSALQKISTESEKVGFKRYSLSEDETKVITMLKDKL